MDAMNKVYSFKLFKKSKRERQLALSLNISNYKQIWETLIVTHLAAQISKNSS